MKKKTLQAKVGIAALTAGVLLGGVFFAFVYAPAFAFNGPSQAPSGGSGAIGSDSSNNVSVGTSTTISGTKLEVVGAGSNDTGSYAAQFFQNNKTPIFILRDDGSVSIETSTISAGNTVIGGNLTVGGTFTANGLTGTISAGNVSSGQFGSNTGGGNYSFPTGSMVANNSTNYGDFGSGLSSGSLNWNQTGSGWNNISSAGALGLVVATDQTTGTTFQVSSGVYNTTTDQRPNHLLTVLGSGNVGIGTTAPATKLEVGSSNTTLSNVQTTLSNNALAVSATYGSGSNYIPGLVWYTTDNNSTRPKAGVWEYQDGSGSKLYFGTSNAYSTGITNTAMVIDPSGNVGIGTTAPAGILDLLNSNQHLTILANTALTGSWPGTSQATTYTIQSSGSSAGNIAFATGNSEVMRITSGGNVGVGTTTPGYKLDVQGGQINSSGGYCINGGNCITSWPTGNAGTVTSITAGSGLSGGTITGSGTIGVNYGSSASTAVQGNTSITVGAGSGLSGGGSITLGAGGSATLSLNTANANIWTAEQTFNAAGPTLNVGSGGNSTTHYDVYTGSYDTTAGYATYAGNWASSGYWGIGPLDGGSDNTIRIGNVSNSAGTWSGTQNLNLSIGGNLSVGGTVGGSYTGSISAGNVSSGSFGSNTGGGTYTFPAQVNDGATGFFYEPSTAGTTAYGLNAPGTDYMGIGPISPSSGVSGMALGYSTTANGTLSPVLTVTQGGNVGIGTTNPGYKLDVQGGQINSSGGYCINGANCITSWPSGNAGTVTSITAGSGLSGGTITGSGTISLNTGNANTWSAAQTFNGGASANAFSVGSSAYTNQAGDIGVSRNASPTTGVIYLGSGGSHYLYFDGTNYQLPSGGLTLGGNLNMGSNKLTVGTIDPVYSIDGTNYATYGADMTGVNEETDGTLTLARGTDGTYSTTIDFGAQATGSDLWLFAHATALTANGNLANLVVILTPSFDGNVWYKKNVAAGTVTIYGNQAGEVSYRFTAPRFDASQWSNTAPATETASFKL